MSGHPLDGLAQALIGCDWGRLVQSPDDQTPCGERASKRIAVHRSEDDVAGLLLKLCPRHASYVMEETAVRTAPVLEGEDA